MVNTIEIRVNGATVFETQEAPVPYQQDATRDADDACQHFQSIRNRPQEVFAMTTFNGANQPIKTRWITTGLLDSNQVHPREVFAPAIQDRASGIIVAHNHPSGTLEASMEDLAITKRLVKAGDILGIRVLDHLILTKSGHISLKQKGAM